MGLNFSHTHATAQWSFHGFRHFRRALAAHEGITLTDMDGFRPDRRPGLSWNPVTSPLEPLLNHPDDEGVLTPAQCRQAEPRLREAIAALWPEDCHNRRAGLALADGMNRAAAADEDLTFHG